METLYYIIYIEYI